MLVDREESLRTIFATSPLLLMAHCEDTDIINQNIKEFKKRYPTEYKILFDEWFDTVRGF